MKKFKPTKNLFMRNQILKLFLVPTIIIILVAGLFVSCNKEIQSSSCQIQLPQSLNPVPFSVLSENETNDGNRVCSSKQVEWGPSYDEIISLDPLSGVIYPMAVLNYNSIKDGSYIPVSGKRKPATISISLSNITGKVSAKIDNPSLSTIRTAIQGILQSKTGGGTAAKISWKQSEIYSQEHFRLSIGGNYGSLWGDLNAQYDYANDQIIGRFLFQFTQEYYSIDADVPSPGMGNFFESAPDCKQVNGVSPAWVSSVKYGRKVFLMIESKTLDYSHTAEIQASFDAFFASGGITADVTLSKLVNEKSIKGVIIGGPSYEGIKAITSINGIKDYLLKGANFDVNSPGVPLSFTLRFINDNSIAKLVLYDKFTIKDCSIIPASTTSFQPASIKEIKLNHDLGDKDFGGNGPKVTLKAELYPSNNNKEVWVRLTLNMKETCCDNTSGFRIYEQKLWTCPSGKKINAITSAATQTVTYTDNNDPSYHRIDFPVSNVIHAVEFLGDTSGDDFDLSDIESTSHLHIIAFNKIYVKLVNG